MFGANANGDVVMWSSAKQRGDARRSIISRRREVKRLIAAGAVLPPIDQPMPAPRRSRRRGADGMVMGIGYGPEAYFADKPKAPKWTTRVRYKTTASVMHGMGAMMGGGAGMGANPPDPQAQRQQPPKKKKRFGIGDLLGGAIPVPH